MILKIPSHPKHSMIPRSCESLGWRMQLELELLSNPRQTLRLCWVGSQGWGARFGSSALRAPLLPRLPGRAVFSRIIPRFLLSQAGGISKDLLPSTGSCRGKGKHSNIPVLWRKTFRCQILFLWLILLLVNTVIVPSLPEDGAGGGNLPLRAILELDLCVESIGSGKS